LTRLEVDVCRVRLLRHSFQRPESRCTAVSRIADQGVAVVAAAGR
jgi:hypothetical protein